MEAIKKRSKVLCFILGFAFIAEFFSLVCRSGIVEGLDKRADKLRRFAVTSRNDATILPGDFYDRNGNVLVETTWKTTESGKKVKDTTYKGGKVYSQLIGYSSGHILNLSGESAESVVQGRDDYRLMAFLDEDDWGDNGLYSTVDADGTKGQSVCLTLDHSLQLHVYEVLRRQMSETSHRGSAVVMDAKTGEILSMVAFPAYDFNELQKAKIEMQKAEEETDLEPGFPITYKGAQAPGSIFKVLMAAALIDHGMEDFAVADEPFMVNGWKCRNAYSSRGDTITYYEGIERSSNVFFAQAALVLGKDKLRESAEKFMLFEDKNQDGADDTCLRLDFGDVQYNWNLDVPEDILAQTGFGQGKTELSTVYAAMITQAIANDGVMMKPYLIQNLIDADGKKVYEGKPEVLSKATGKSTADKVTEAMLAAAAYNCTHHSENRKIAGVFNQYKIAGKTGTAQNGDQKNSVNAWFISFAPADDPRYVVVVNQCKTDKGGYKMMTAAADIYQYLFGESRLSN